MTEDNSQIEPAKLVVLEKSGEPRQFRLTGTTHIVTGELTGLADGVLTMNYPFRDHDLGDIEYEGGRWKYRDLSEETETYVNGANVQTGYDKVLENGDVIKVENSEITLVCVFIDYYQPDVTWQTISLENTSDMIHIYGHGDGVTSEVARTSEEIREDRHHALLRFKEGTWNVEDINTERGVFVNRQKVEGERKLGMYDVICIGNTVFVYQENRLIFNHKSAVNNRLVIHIEERAVRSLFRKKVLLSDINLSIDSGNMVLILGGSGVGKTTFINAVTGYEKAKATITQAGRDVYKDYKEMKYEIGFVPQQDLLRGNDNVRMTLVNAAQLRMPRGTSARERESRVDEVLDFLGLDTVRDELVEKLSGGQRKRLSIGVEFMADPQLFILDEPDSGLDGTMARALFGQLRKIADTQKIVMVITHTPDRVIDLFDKVIVLAKDEKQTGRLCFYGSIAEAKDFFQRESMEQIVRAINQKDEGGEGLADEFIEKYKAYRENQKDRQ
ncbi:ABC-type multidrug transport system, ATPase component [Lachnospiraceae bacterium NK3A20]|nr:ABC-type multidrug transport system, ATPase component [Lachnospiraceae bacterium NK3A20]